MALRSQLLRRVSGSGGMAVTELAVEAVEERLKASEWSGLSLAVVNTPSSTVVSGPSEVVERWVQRLGEEGVFCRRVNVDYASHSAEMDPILAELESALSDLAPQAGQVPMVSTVTGARCEGTTLDGTYWCRNLRQTVRLDLALEELIGDGHGVFVEASAHPVLAMPLSTASGEGGGVVVGSLRREAGGMSELLRNLGMLHCHGFAVDWEKVLGAGVSKRLVALPTYAFQRQRYWLEAEKASGDISTMGQSSADHPLLGAATPLADSERFLLTGRLSAAEPGWLGDHAVFGTVLLPGTGLLELGFAAARAVGATTVSQLTLVAPLVLPEDGAVRVQVQVDAPEAGEEGRRGLSIYSRLEEAPDGTAWTLHAQGMLSGAEATAAMPEEVGLEAWPPVGGTPIDLTGLYSTLQAHGFGYGPAFQGLREAWRVGDAVYGRVVLPEALSNLGGSLRGASCAPRCGAARLVARGRRGRPRQRRFGAVAVRVVGGVAARDRRAGAASACIGGAEWRGRSLGPAAVGRWQRASGGARGGAAAEGSERSANPRGDAERGAAPVPGGMASGGVERGRAGSDRHHPDCRWRRSAGEEVGPRLGRKRRGRRRAPRPGSGGARPDGIRPFGGNGCGRRVLSRCRARWRRTCAERAAVHPERSSPERDVGGVADVRRSSHGA